MRKLMALAAVGVLLGVGLVAGTAVDAGNGVTPKVTGGADAASGTIDFTLAVNVIEDKDGNVRGKIQYSREDQAGAQALKFHASVECSELFSSGTTATAVGPITNVQEDPAGQIDLDTMNFAVVAVEEGSPDRVRVYFVSSDDSQSACTTEETSFPGIVQDGNYTLREP